jgi:hypothetical protein
MISIPLTEDRSSPIEFEVEEWEPSRAAAQREVEKLKRLMTKEKKVSVEKVKLDWLEVADLAMHVCGLPDDADLDRIDQALCDQFDIGLEQLESLLEVLIPLCRAGQSPLSGKWYRGFANGDIWLAKHELLK